MSDGNVLEIYVHIPFCVRKCAYCDFYSGPAGGTTVRAYVKSVIREIGESPFGGEDRLVTSVFFGGGTPSLITPEELGGILGAVRKNFHVLPDAEITLEANPGTADSPKLSAFRDLGVNRLSLGLQSVRNDLLRKIGRIHDFETFLRCYDEARKAGFSNINIDLLSGLPGDTPDSFEKGLKTVLELRPEHLSVYALILEENTPFMTLYEAGKLDLPKEDEEREMAHRARSVLLASGYRHYEISNFALPGYECRQNEGYWTHVPYLGFGAAAASFYGNRRFRNVSALDYDGRPYEETEVLSEEDLMNEFLMLGLRRLQGVRNETFRQRFGRSFLEFKGEAIQKLAREGLLQISGDPGGEIISLSERGLDLANVVFREFV